MRIAKRSRYFVAVLCLWLCFVHAPSCARAFDVDSLTKSRGEAYRIEAVSALKDELWKRRLASESDVVPVWFAEALRFQIRFPDEQPKAQTFISEQIKASKERKRSLDDPWIIAPYSLSRGFYAIYPFEKTNKKDPQCIAFALHVLRMQQVSDLTRLASIAELVVSKNSSVP